MAAPVRRSPAQLPLRSPLRRKNLRLRPLAVLLAALGVLAWATPSLTSLGAGAALAALGLGLRLWATGYLEKGERLTLEGPYRFLRHPLYAGAMAIGLGALVAAGPRVASVGSPLGLAFFFLYYLPYKERRESRRLEARFGERFRVYRDAVRPLRPRLRPFPAGSDARRPAETWSLARVFENDELGTLVGVALLFATLALGLDSNA